MSGARIANGMSKIECSNVVRIAFLLRIQIGSVPMEKGNKVRMKPGDFIDIHTPDGCVIAKLVSDDGDTVTARIGTIIGEQTFYEIPKEIVTLFKNV